MPSVEDLKANNMVTGPSTTIKAGAVNLRTRAKALKAAAYAESSAIPCPANGCKYRSPNNNFRCGGIVFGSAFYATNDPKELKVLDSCVDRKLLYVEQDNRKAPAAATPKE